MDLTPKYIKMCEKADNIQEEFKATEMDLQDRLYCEKNNIEFFITRTGKIYFYSETMGDWIFLPQQDQIQERIKKELPYLPRFYFISLQNFMEEMEYKNILFDSYEQLFLAFYMYKKHKKVWDDEKEEWVDETGVD